MADKFAKGLFRNPETGSEINTENFTGRDSSGNTIAGGLTAENLGQQGFSQLQSERRGSGELFFGERDPITGQRYERFIQRPKGFFEPKIPGVTNTKNHSQGTESIRDENKILGDELGGDIAGAEKGVQSNADIIADLTNMQKNIGKTTDDELKRIQEAGEAAGSAFDAQLSDALESRRRELPSDIVRAGEAGGFENTQVAGAAALLPTTPKAGESFVGAGGLLSQQRQLLDRNVSLVRAEQQRAIEAAKSAERNFKRTGKRQDFEDAKALVTLSQQLKQNEEDMLRKREQLWLSKQSGARAERTADFNIIKSLKVGESINIGGRTFNSIAQPEAFWTDDRVFQTMKTMPIGDSMDVTDKNGDPLVIFGIAQDDPNTQIFHSVNQNTGDETYTTLDKNTGDLINQSVSKGTGARFKAGGAGGAGGDSKEKTAFYKDIDSATNDLRSGATWGQTWNMLYTKYKHSEEEEGAKEQNESLGVLLDNLMDKDVWSEKGAFQQFKGSTKTKNVVSTSYNEDGSKTIIYSDGSNETIK